MADTLGTSFAPLRQRFGEGGGTADDVQRAIQVLNLRLPRFEGARGVAPLPLLSPGSAGGGVPSHPGGMDMGAVVRALLQQMAASGSSAPSLASPAVPGGGATPARAGGSPFGSPAGRPSGQVASQAQAVGRSPLPRISFEDEAQQPPTRPQPPAGPPQRNVGQVIDRTSPQPRPRQGPMRTPQRNVSRGPVQGGRLAQGPTLTDLLRSFVG